MAGAVALQPTRTVAVESPLRLATRKFVRHRLALVGALVLAVIAILSIGAPLFAPHDPLAVDVRQFRRPPSPDHLLGTDSAGRDVLSRVLYAGRVSLLVGVAAALASMSVGLVLGSVAGALGGRVDVLLMRITDVFLSFPSLIVIMVIVALAGQSIWIVILGITLFEWPIAARIVRGVALSVREQEFMVAAKVVGVPQWRLITRHLVPAVLSPLTVAATVTVALAIRVEATLSFLGLSVRPPQPTWGNMLNEAQSLTILESMPWLWLAPGLAIAFTVLAVNFVGDGLRDALDPRQRLT
jgi:peptide/nickel transport system permease protein